MNKVMNLCLSFGFSLVLCQVAMAGDLIIKRNGQSMQGTIVSETDTLVKLNISMGGVTATTTIKKKDIKFIMSNGKKRVINADTPTQSTSKKSTPKPAASVNVATASSTSGKTASLADIKKQIDAAGKQKPDWWDSAKLNYPKTLDLSWTKPTGKWNARKNPSQYLWSVVNPNPRLWKDGLRMVHHSLGLIKGQKAKEKELMFVLGHMYGHLLQDYERCAFWVQKAKKVSANIPNPERGDLQLADAYFQVGATSLAESILKKHSSDRTRRAEVIKLWASMGNLKKALSLADKRIKSGYIADAAYAQAGDACRLHGDYKKAEAYYTKGLTLKKGGRDYKQNMQIMKDALQTIVLFEGLELSTVKDGQYSGTSMGYNGQIPVIVSVISGKITQCKVGRHKEKQFYSSIVDTTGQILDKQSVHGIDATSGATITSKAIIQATAMALHKGKQ